MPRPKINKKKIVKKLSRAIKIPPAKIISSGKEKKKYRRAGWKKELWELAREEPGGGGDE